MSVVESRKFKWSSKTLWGYGVGHIENDLKATMWFSYLLVFFDKVIGLSAVNAGILLIIGQLTDGIATPLFGLALDKLGVCGRFYGQRKSWHLLGTLLTAFSFAFIFSPPPSYEPLAESGNLTLSNINESNYAWPQVNVMLYYIFFIMVFQIGWASVQVSHLSFIPCLTSHDKSRIQLTSLRNAFRILSSIAIYLTTFALLQTSKSEPLDVTQSAVTETGNITKGNDVISWKDRFTYTYLAVGTTVIGLLFQVFVFHFLVKEPVNTSLVDTNDEEKSQDTITVNQEHDKFWFEWLKCPSFYAVCAQYCFTRLIVNVLQSYMPYYLQETLQLSKEYIAIVPLVQFVAGFLVSFAIKPLAGIIQKNDSYLLGCFLMLIASVWASILEGYQQAAVFMVTILYGFGTSIIWIQSLTITAALINKNASSAAFVYGAMSLTEKVTCGVVIVIIQSASPCDEKIVDANDDCVKFYRQLFGYAIGTISIGAVLINELVAYIMKSEKERLIARTMKFLLKTAQKLFSRKGRSINNV